MAEKNPDNIRLLQTHFQRQNDKFGAKDFGVSLIFRNINKHQGEMCRKCSVDLSTRMKFGTDVEKNIIDSGLKSTEAGLHKGHCTFQIQDGHQTIFDCFINLLPKILDHE